jgi:hypothetical protein
MDDARTEQAYAEHEPSVSHALERCRIAAILSGRRALMDNRGAGGCSTSLRYAAPRMPL